MHAALPSDHDRPRERAERLGLEALSNAELVAILLATAGRRGSTVGDLARQLIREFGSIERLATATVADLTRTEGTLDKIEAEHDERLSCQLSIDGESPGRPAMGILGQWLARPDEERN